MEHRFIALVSWGNNQTKILVKVPPKFEEKSKEQTTNKEFRVKLQILLEDKTHDLFRSRLEL